MKLIKLLTLFNEGRSLVNSLTRITQVLMFTKWFQNHHFLASCLRGRQSRPIPSWAGRGRSDFPSHTGRNRGSDVCPHQEGSKWQNVFSFSFIVSLPTVHVPCQLNFCHKTHGGKMRSYILKIFEVGQILWAKVSPPWSWLGKTQREPGEQESHCMNPDTSGQLLPSCGHKGKLAFVFPGTQSSVPRGQKVHS